MKIDFLNKNFRKKSQDEESAIWSVANLDINDFCMTNSGASILERDGLEGLFRAEVCWQHYIWTNLYGEGIFLRLSNVLFDVN